MNHVVSVVLKGMPPASKVLLMFFLARVRQPAELGLYGLLIATIVYGLYFLGFDCYSSTKGAIQQKDRRIDTLTDEAIRNQVRHETHLLMSNSITSRVSSVIIIGCAYMLSGRNPRSNRWLP